MQIPKDKIIEMIRNRGDHTQADQAAAELPGEVDTDQHQNLLEKFGVNPGDLLGGLGNKLGM